MKITEVRVTKFNGDGNLKAFANVTLDKQLVLTGLKVMSSVKGDFVAMASKKDKDGEYKDIFFPITKEFREELTKAVMDKYNATEDAPAPETNQVEEDDELPF